MVEVEVEAEAEAEGEGAEVELEVEAAVVGSVVEVVCKAVWKVARSAGVAQIRRTVEGHCRIKGRVLCCVDLLCSLGSFSLVVQD